MASEKLNLYQKMAHVSLNVGAIAKNEKHYSGYMFQSIEAVSDALRNLMADIGLVMFTECTSYEWLEGHWVCSYIFTFVDADTGKSQACHWQQSTQAVSAKGKVDDKAMGINHSYAQKYFLMRTFLISSNQDVDENEDASVNSQWKKQVLQPKPTELATDETNIVITNVNGNKTWHVIEGCVVWSRDVFIELGFCDKDDEVYEHLAQVGVTKLSDNIRVVYSEITKGDKTQKNALRIQRVDTEEVYVIKESK